MKYLSVILILGVWATAAYAEVKVVDGDSLEIGERRIRLDGIDAPEFTQKCFSEDEKEYDCGLESLRFVENFVANKKVECDCSDEKDRYKRELCECFANGESINKAMISAGWAMEYRKPEYLSLQDEAENSKRGMWQGKFMRPALFRALEYSESKNK